MKHNSHESDLIKIVAYTMVSGTEDPSMIFSQIFR